MVFCHLNRPNLSLAGLMVSPTRDLCSVNSLLPASRASDRAIVAGYPHIIKRLSLNLRIGLDARLRRALPVAYR